MSCPSIRKNAFLPKNRLWFVPGSLGAEHACLFLSRFLAEGELHSIFFDLLQGLVTTELQKNDRKSKGNVVFSLKVFWWGVILNGLPRSSRFSTTRMTGMIFLIDLAIGQRSNRNRHVLGIFKVLQLNLRTLDFAPKYAAARFFMFASIIPENQDDPRSNESYKLPSTSRNHKAIRIPIRPHVV